MNSRPDAPIPTRARRRPGGKRWPGPFPDGPGQCYAQGAFAVPESPEYHPHVSIAYSNADVPTGPVREHVAPLSDIESVTIPIAAAQLSLNRDNQMYEWDVVADVPLGRD